MSPSTLPSVEDDIAEVTRIHDEWWEANRDFDVQRMRACFVESDGFLQYNLNGHTYWNLGELTQLWESIKPYFAIPEYEVIDLRVEVRGDMAWVAHEAVIEIRPTEGNTLPPSVPSRSRVRETEVLVRDDGKGNAVWKIWHHHCSIHAPDDEVRMGFDDTVLSRAA